MAIVRPFRGIRYDASVVGPIERVIAPPYDVIGADEQGRLYDTSPFNAVRLDLGREQDRYGSAARAFREWQSSGALVRDPEPAFYVYAQRYRIAGEERERWGFFSRLRLEDLDSGVVRAHERTLAAPKADRLELQRATRANLSPIFGIYSVPGWSLADAVRPALGAAEVDIPDLGGVGHRLWRVADPAVHRELAARLADRTVYIADGHHRYETALRYRDEMREATGRRSGEEPFDHVLAFLANVEEPGLTVLPTHRLVKDLAMPAWSFIVRLRQLFLIDELPKVEGVAAFLRALEPRADGERRLGAVLHGLDGYLVLVARPGEGALPEGASLLRRLDVSLLHGLVLEGLLGREVHREAESGGLAYVKDAEEAIARVERGEFAAGFLLNATRVEEVLAVCDAGELMPEKSTYFYPKIPTGLVFNSLED